MNVFAVTLSLFIALASSLVTVTEESVDQSIQRFPLRNIQDVEVEKIQEAISLDQSALYRFEFSSERRGELEQDLADARKNFDADPDSLKNTIWYGRRLAYLWRYQDAIKVFSDGIEKHPDDPRLYRHRGHRYITIRKFEQAISDLETAAKLIEKHDIPDSVEQDGQPNNAGIPTSSLYTNVYYHLGLAHYLSENFEKAAESFEKCLSHSKNHDMTVATLDWLYLTHLKKGSTEKADELLKQVRADWKILENHAYHRRLLMYKGEMTPEELINLSATNDDPAFQLDLATYGYGMGMWYFNKGERDKARELFKKVTAGKYWSAFGFIAAERELLDAVKDEKEQDK